MKVYVIEKGMYSDRHVVGVVETEEKANAVVKAIEDSPYNSDCSYTEYDTDQFNTVRFRYLVNYFCGCWYAEYDDSNIYDYIDKSQKIYDDFYVVYADSVEQAIKIAQDMYYKEMAEKEGLL